MTEECRSCYRPIAEGRTHCARCATEVRSRTMSAPLILVAVIAAGLLVTGMLTLNTRLLVTGAVVAGGAALAHVVMSMRG